MSEGQKADLFHCCRLYASTFESQIRRHKALAGGQRYQAVEKLCWPARLAIFVALWVASEAAPAALAWAGIAPVRIAHSAARRAPTECVHADSASPRHLRAGALRPPPRPPCGERLLIATTAQQSFSTACYILAEAALRRPGLLDLEGGQQIGLVSANLACSFLSLARSAWKTDFSRAQS